MKKINKESFSILATLAIVMVVFLKNCGKGGHDNTEDMKNPSISPESKISDSVIVPYDKKAYPKMFKRYGSARVKKANELLRPAAIKAARSESCDTVSVVELSDNRSTKDELVFFVDCANGERFYISEKDTESETPATAVSALIPKKSDLIESCHSAIQSKLNVPSSFDGDYISADVNKHTQGATVKFNFTAKNKIGNELSGTGRCSFDDTGMLEAEISSEYL